MKFIAGQWVRLPRVMGHAEGIIKGDKKLWLQDDEDDFAWFVLIPQLERHVLCPESWLTSIEPPRDYPDAPKWNPTSEGHPTAERQEAEVNMVLAYIRKIEFGSTEQNCWCPWTPLKVAGKMGRLRTGEHPQCPVHTKEGYLFGFIDHVRRTFRDDVAADAYKKVLIEGTEILGMLPTVDPVTNPNYGVPDYEGPDKRANVRFIE